VSVDKQLSLLLPWKLRKKIGVSAGDKIQLFFNIVFGLFFLALILYATYFLVRLK
jgi:bifunctional DNA-binding transcriptional regulator/antitoxin component of YhaV-PrlF toxin-antitoxin module